MKLGCLKKTSQVPNGQYLCESFLSDCIFNIIQTMDTRGRVGVKMGYQNFTWGCTGHIFKKISPQLQGHDKSI